MSKVKENLSKNELLSIVESYFIKIGATIIFTMLIVNTTFLIFILPLFDYLFRIEIPIGLKLLFLSLGGCIASCKIYYDEFMSFIRNIINSGEIESS